MTGKPQRENDTRHPFFDGAERIMPRGQVRHCLHVSPEAGYLYAELPKAGCTTIKFVLQNLHRITTGAPVEPFDRERIHARRCSPLASVYDMPADALDAAIRGRNAKRITLVRNPYSRIVSAYLSKISKRNAKMKIKVLIALGRAERPTPGRPPKPEDLAAAQSTPISFEEFIDAIERSSTYDMDIHWRPSRAQVFTDELKFDYVGKFEKFDNFFADVFQLLNVPESLRVPEASNKTKANMRLQEFIGAEDVLAKINAIYAKDFEAFGYPIADRLGDLDAAVNESLT